MSSTPQPPSSVAPELGGIQQRYDAPEGMVAARWYLGLSGVGLLLLVIGLGTATAWCESLGSGLFGLGLVFAVVRWLQAGWTELDGAEVRTWQRFGASEAVSWSRVRGARSRGRRRQLVLTDHSVVDLPGMTRRDAARLAAALDSRRSADV